MKNKRFVWVLCILTVFAALTLAGCITGGIVTAGTGGTISEGTSNGKFGEHTRTPVKDFQTVGLVFTETQLATSSNKEETGQIFTYQALLKEAKALGADAIINVVIDKKIQVSISFGSRITTWYGSALAIKYTTTLTGSESTTVGATTTVKTSVYFNEDAPANTAGKVEPPGEKQAPAEKQAPVEKQMAQKVLGLRQ